MNAKPCPFCGDTRSPSIEEEVMTFDPPNLFKAACQCCGAVGPTAPNHGSALIMWDERRAPGDTKAFCDLADRLSGVPTALGIEKPGFGGSQERA